MIRIFGINKDFEFDFSKDKIDDLVNLKSEVYESRKFDSVYWFGYKFNENVDSKTRTELIHFIRGLSEKKMREEDKRLFIEKPLVELSKKASVRDIEAVIYPDSPRSDLNVYQGQIVGRYFNKRVIPIRLIKSATKEVEFDYDRYFEDNYKKFPHAAALKQARLSIDNLMDRIHNSDYFSIAELRTKYRNYIQGYLRFADDTTDLTKYNKVMLIDDIATTGATLDYMIMLCKNLNPEIEIFVYSIIGK